ncbi:MAG: type II toxin-antitoxin system VapC family toxin [Planctomycetota bacterium]
MTVALLDTDVVISLMRRHAGALEQARAHLGGGGQLAFSVITQYEVLRGFRQGAYERQRERFEAFCACSRILPIDEAVAVFAARQHRELQEAGSLIADADLLIAATAVTHDCTLVTGNVRHFERLPGVRLANWLAEQPDL